MYSIVLMMALGGGAEAPALTHDKPAIPGQELNRFFGCHGCCGCCGGCWGGYGCHGCCGGCWGGYGCCGGCYGCCGGYVSYGCCGGYVGCYGCCGGYVGCYGCCGGMTPVYMAPPMGGAVPVPMVAPGAERMPAPAGGETYIVPSTPVNPGYTLPVGSVRVERTSDYYGAAPSAPVAPVAPVARQRAVPATITVSLPADARLTFGDQVTRSTSTTRTFLSPPLEPGVSYYYTLKAELVRNDRQIVETRRISVRGGMETKVSFNLDSEAVAQR